MANKLLNRMIWRFIPHRVIAWFDRWRSAWSDFLPEIITKVPSHRFRLYMYRRLGAKIGISTSVHRGCQFYQIDQLIVGNNTVINQKVTLDSRKGLTIGRNVSVSEQSMLYTLQHDLDDPSFKTIGGPIIIDDYVFIGARAIILPGVHLGEGCCVAAGAVVTKDVPPYTVVAGVPARFLRYRERDLKYQLDYRRLLY